MHPCLLILIVILFVCTGAFIAARMAMNDARRDHEEFIRGVEKRLGIK